MKLKNLVNTKIAYMVPSIKPPFVDAMHFNQYKLHSMLDNASILLPASIISKTFTFYIDLS